MATDLTSLSSSELVPAAPSATGASQETPLVSRGLAVVLLAALGGFIVIEGQALWSEWRLLQVERERVRDSSVIGYYNIAAHPSYAQKPVNWYHDDGAQTLLWSGWRNGQGHQWFRVGRGEVERGRISHPIGRDVIQAIDHPVVEVGGGPIWGRIPDNAAVVGLELAGISVAYPVLVLDKVEVVNDEVGGRPVLVTYNPFVSAHEAVQVFDPVVDGRRVTMGLSGYLHDHKPLLYDRGTESLWVEQNEYLGAIAGKHKGSRLHRLHRATPMSWGNWRSRYPRSRLLVGADRSRPLPPL